jgi:hypothetical protein
MLEDDQRDRLLLTFKHNRELAHKVLFSHRHKDETPEFHKEMCALLYDPHPRVAEMAFRGAAKSTWLEEYVLLSALFRESLFPMVIGPKWESACERLAPMRNELETNEALIELFGDQKSSPWSMDELGLANGVKIQAVGAGQSMRGKKHNDERPDLAAIDDLEDEENIATEEARRKLDRWLTGTLLPALHPTKGKVRFIGTAIHPKSLIIKKCNDPEWKSRVFPIVNIDPDTGEEKSAWPSRFPLEWVKKLRQDYINSGNFIEFEQEYMCRAEDVAGKPFQPRMLKVEAAPAVHLPVYMMVDPARTTKDKSARTGYAAWSWVGNKLIVHKAEGHFHKPDEIVNTILEWDKEFEPVLVGVEAVGLEDFILQPLKVACARAGRSVPWADIRAPKDKLSFIKGLQPFYIAGDVVHVKHLPDLEQELLQFPTGRMDVPNALAYSLRMRAGRPVYEDFTLKHIAEVLEPLGKMPAYLCVSSRPSMTAGVLLQYTDGLLRILHDWVYNEPPMECFDKLIREAILVAGGQVKVSAPFEQFDIYNNTGLPAAIKKEYITPVKAATAANSEGQLREWLRKQVRGETALLVAKSARWTRNAFCGGYARKLDKGGKLADYPTDDQYRLVMEAIETFAGWIDKHNGSDSADAFRYAVTNSGKRFISLRE